MTGLGIGIGIGNNFGGGGVADLTPTLPAITNTLVEVYSLYKLVNGYMGPLFAVCSPSAANTPALTADVYPDASGNPVLGPAYAALSITPGNPLHLWRLYGQKSGFHATSPNQASRFDILASNAWGGRIVFSSTAAVEYIIIPDTLVTSRQDITTIHVQACRGGQDNGVNFSTGTGTNTSIYNTISDAGGWQVLGNTFVPAVRHARVTPSVLAIAAGTGNTKLHRNGHISTGVAITAAVGLLGGAIGGSHSTANGINASYREGFIDHFAHMIYSGQASDADVGTIKTFLYSKFGITDNATADVKCLGDSIMHGQGSSTGIGIPSLILPMLSNRVADVANISQPGRRMSVPGGASAGTFNAWIGNKHDNTKTPTVLLTNMGTNDVDFGDIDTVVEGYMSNVKSRFFSLSGAKKLAFCTILNRGSAGWPGAKQLVADSVNTWMRANLPDANTIVIDTQAIPQLANPADTTYFLADQVHLNDAGYALMAALIGPAINTLIT